MFQNPEASRMIKPDRKEICVIKEIIYIPIKMCSTSFGYLQIAKRWLDGMIWYMVLLFKALCGTQLRINKNLKLISLY